MLVPPKSLEQFVAVWLCSVILLTKLPVVPDEREIIYKKAYYWERSTSFDP